MAAPELTLAQTGLINGNAANNGGNPLNKLIVPGDTAHSIVLNRMAVTNGFTRMPPIATNELDQTNIALVTDWITQAAARTARPTTSGAPRNPSILASLTTDADSDSANNQCRVPRRHRAPQRLEFLRAADRRCSGRTSASASTSRRIAPSRSRPRWTWPMEPLGCCRQQRRRASRRHRHAHRSEARSEAILPAASLGKLNPRG